jgi:hypothetical protein
MANQFFNFGENNVNKLREFCEYRNNVSSNTEFEIRFGSFQYDKATKRSNFISGCEIDFFYKLMQSFESKGFAKEITNTVETMYKNPDGNGTIKQIKNQKNTTFSYVLKNNYKKTYDVYDYDLRLSLASEETLDNDKAEKLVEKQEPMCKREKERTSFIMPYGRLDFTIVGNEVYELEFEITNTQTNQFNSILHMLTVILQTRQDNFYVVSNYQKRNVLLQYKALLNLKYPIFVGAQPETLQKNKIAQLYKQPYSVTDKADGDRCFMYIDDKGFVFLLDANVDKICKTNLQSGKYSNCIIDGERVNHAGVITFMAFDVLAFNGVDIRGNDKYLLEARLDNLTSIVSSIPCTNMYSVEMKTFYFKNVFLGSQVILETADKKSYKNDGLIFTPMHEPYPLTRKWGGLLKWKPAELNTIDFFAVKESDGFWKLFVQHTPTPTPTPTPQASSRPQSELVLFDVEKLCNTSCPIDGMTFQTTIPESTIDPSTGYPFKTRTVIEFRWDVKACKFVPLRTRWDKTANPRKHGNFSAVACDVWNNIHNPIEKELLYKFSVGSNKEDQCFDKMRRFHNKVKEYMYSKYARNVENMLELCSGRGGDMHKWLHNNVSNVVGYDISERNIAECKRRWAEAQAKQNAKFNYNYNFHKLDLCSSNAIEKIYQNTPNKFQVISCQFGIHYFFGSDTTIHNIINILDTTLEENGIFMITFMDDTCLEDLMDKNTIQSKISNNELQYMIKKQFNQVKIILNGNSILSEGSDEFVIDFHAFANLMHARGYAVVETELFKNLPPSDFPELELLKECEKDISFLNRYCVFQKGINNMPPRVVNLDTLVQPCQVVPKLFQSCETIDLQQANLSVFKLTSKYDVIDVMNCINYRCYKQTIENKDIESFDDITHVFNSFPLELVPKFIADPLNLNEYEPTDGHVYFTNYKHVTEKKPLDDSQQQQEYTNWYILMHKDKLLFSRSAMTHLQVEPTLVEPTVEQTVVEPTLVESMVVEPTLVESTVEQTVVEPTLVESMVVEATVEPTVEQTVVEPTLGESTVVEATVEPTVEQTVVEPTLVESTVVDMINNGKTTIKVLKDLLSERGLKVTGKKEELRQRLLDFFENLDSK